MSKITKSILDPSKKVHHVSMNDQYPDPQYFDKDNNRIPYVDIEEKYKPEYDFETTSVKHWWFRNESTLYFDVHTEIAKFRSRTTFGKYWKATRKMLAHKLVWRHL